MAQYEYKVIPAPKKGRKAPGVKKPDARFAYGLQEVMNAAAAEGWEYQRADILPSEERQGLTSSQTVYRSVLVFRRRVAGEMPATDDSTDTANDAAAAVAAVAAAEAAGDDPRAVYREGAHQEPEPEPFDVPAADADDEEPVEYAIYVETDRKSGDTTPQHDFETYEDTTTSAASDDAETTDETEDDTVSRG